MYNRPVNSHFGTVDAHLNEGATYVYWIYLDVHTSGTLGEVTIRDGNTDSSPLKVMLTADYCREFSFLPPFKCERGLYVDKGSGIDAYFIGFLDEKVALAKE